MCGLVGFISKNSTVGNSTTKAFTQMLYTDVLRGEDSTGIIFGTREGKHGWYKEAEPGYKFLADKKVRKILNDSKLTFMVGHNRAATSGAAWQQSGAHPFEHGNITMVHNGTLENHYELPNGQQFEVDSEAVCYNLNANGYTRTIKEIEGAFTLIWYNKSAKRLCFVRNGERAFAIAETPYGIFFASEKKMLEWVLDRNNIHINKIYDLPIGYLYQYDITSQDLQPRVRKMEMAPLVSRYNNWMPRPQNLGKPQGSSLPASARVKSEPSHFSQEAPIDGYVMGAQHDMDKYVDCCICTDYLPVELGRKVMGSDEWVCDVCDKAYYKFNGDPEDAYSNTLPPLEVAGPRC